MEIYIVEDDMSVISVLQDIIEDNDLGIVCGTSEDSRRMWMISWQRTRIWF